MNFGAPQSSEDCSVGVRDGYPKSDCAEMWKKHRTLTWINWALFAAWVPFGIFVLNIAQWTHSNYAGLALIPYFVVFMIVGTRVSLFRCPRCGNRFHRWGPWGIGNNPFARKCWNCGLRKWQCD
jgi:hypothetical protein